MFARCRLVLAFGLLVSLLSLVRGAIITETSSPEEVLASRGLTKFGAYYVLGPDRELGDWQRVTQRTELKYTQAKNRYIALQSQSQQAQTMMEDLESQNEAQTAILGKISKDANGNYNRQVDIVNAIRAKLRECIDVANQTEKELKRTPEPSDQQYVDLVIKFSDMMELVSRRYQALATDDQVKLALQRLNLTARPEVKLGPSPRFVDQLPQVRRLRATVAPPPGVPLDMIEGVPEVPITLNGLVKQDMVLSTTAPYMCITTALAEKLNLQLTAADKIVRIPGEGGKTVDAHLVMLKSVQVGDFTAANVQCAVEPASMEGAKSLLGASFLRHFKYRMDMSAGSLRISPLDASVTGGSTTPDSTSSADLPAVPTVP